LEEGIIKEVNATKMGKIKEIVYAFIDANNLNVETSKNEGKLVIYKSLRIWFRDKFIVSQDYVTILGKVHDGNPNEIPENLIIGSINLPIEIAKGFDYALKSNWHVYERRGY
jgi:hypothetical protein